MQHMPVGVSLLNCLERGESWVQHFIYVKNYMNIICKCLLSSVDHVLKLIE